MENLPGEPSPLVVVREEEKEEHREGSN